MLLSQSHGKSRVRVARVRRAGHEQDISELTVEAVLEGAFERSYTEGDNSGVVATDTIKNLVNITARRELDAGPEDFAGVLAATLLERYPQVSRAVIEIEETVWTRAVVGGAPHPHGFVLDGNGRRVVSLSAGRDGSVLRSGVSGYTFMKTTQSGWTGFVRDDATTLPETTDRIAATAMEARWTWRAVPDDYAAANALVLETMLAVFATTYSHGVQDSLYRMGEAALAAVDAIETIEMACPNKHYIPIDLSPFGLSGDNMVFTPTDEPHGQIRCVVGR